MEDIVKVAILMRKRAFAPYSNYRVGAAVKTKTGKLLEDVTLNHQATGLPVAQNV